MTNSRAEFPCAPCAKPDEFASRSSIISGDFPARFAVSGRRVVTCSALFEAPDNPLGVIENAAIVVDDGRIVAIGPATQITAQFPDVPVVINAQDRVLTPGLVDAHTHLVWAGSRHNEYLLRMQGAGYEQIAASGGGIVSTMKAVREASVDELTDALWRRLSRMVALGTTTCEVKSGYGLRLESELNQLVAIEHLSARADVPRVVPTFLPLHAVPEEGRGNREGWIAEVVNQWLSEVATRKLAVFVDAYIDRNAFSVAEARPLFEKARAMGLGVRAHVGQFADVGGAELAASVGALSVDHLEHVSAEGLRQLAQAGTHAVLLPTACFTLRQEPPPIEAIRAAGVAIVVASDANPGTAPTESLPLAMAFGLHTYHLTASECILGATRHAATSLGLGSECGQLAEGYRADLVVWDLPHEYALLQPWGSPMTSVVMREGKVLYVSVCACNLGVERGCDD